jgi:hypothetical protein
MLDSDRAWEGRNQSPAEEIYPSLSDWVLMGSFFLKTPVTDKAKGQHVSSWYHPERQMKAISKSQVSCTKQL